MKYVLACQTKVLSDMTVTIPQWHSLDKSQILIDSTINKRLYRISDLTLL